MLVFGGSLGARSINQAAVEAFAARRARLSTCCTCRPPRLPRAVRARLCRRATTCASTSTWTSSATRSPPPTWWWRARGGRCSRSPRTACRRSSCPIRTPRPTTRRANARWMADAGAAIVIPDGELDAPRLAQEVAELLADRARLAAMARASRAWPGRTPPRDGRRRAAAGGRACDERRRRKRLARSSGPWSGRRLHFVGVGGAGMSGYARAAHALGAEVSGSDGALSPYAERLRGRRRARGADRPRRRERARGRGRRGRSTRARCRRRTPSGWPRASGAWPSARARSCWRS